LVLEAREAVCQLIGVSDSSRLIVTHSATESLNIAVSGLLKPGDHVITSTMEHNSLARPLHLASRLGVDVTWVPADRHGYVSPRAVAAAIRPDTRLVALTHCSNVAGTIQPVAEIGAIAGRNGTLFLVDAAQSIGSIPVDVAAMHIDLLAAPGHKGLMGPPGTGVLYIAEGVALDPLMVGGTGTASSSLDQPDDLPERYESGTMNAPALAGLAAGAAFVGGVGIGSISRHEAALVNRLMEGLSEIPRLQLYGPPVGEERGSVVSFTVDGMDASKIGFILDHEYEISVRTGLHCAPEAHRTIGTFPAGTVRVSPGYFTTMKEIEACLSAVEQLVRRGE
jgi:cysteine desulfurase family protein